MSPDTFSNNTDCHKERIAAYFDGDLSPLEESTVEKHMAACQMCAAYLNSLKMVSTSLEIFLDQEPVQIPGEFSKRVTAAAESDMQGVRSGSERSRAVFVVACLFVIAAAAVTMSAVGLGGPVGSLPGKVLAAVGLAGHFFYKAATGFSVIFGTVCSKVFFGSTIAVSAILGIFIFSVVVFSKHIRRLFR